MLKSRHFKTKTEYRQLKHQELEIYTGSVNMRLANTKLSNFWAGVSSQLQA